MNIPHLTKDLAVIQKLSDLPNTTDGLSAAALKAKFDEAALSIQSWINDTLIPSLKAENLPFTGSEQLDADNVQAAVQLVFEQVRDASSGTITNGSVTKAKLAEELLTRTFGGRPWISLDKPTADDDPQKEFPVGQIWLRPGFTVNNVAAHNWTANACNVGVDADQITVTGSGEVAEVSISQAFSAIGQKGDRIFVLFDIKDKDPEITSMTVGLGGEEQSAEKGILETVLTGGSMSLQFKALWPSASLAKGSFTVANLAVVNIDEILRQTADAKEMAAWGTYLRRLLPLVSYYSPRELFIQTDTGVWQQFDWEVFPVERGGTGVSQLAAGEMLYGSGQSRMERLQPAEEEHSVLLCTGGVPKWTAPMEAADSCGFARTAENTYVGTGKAGLVELPGRPAVLWLRTDEETHLFFQNTALSGEYTGKCLTKHDTPMGDMETSAAYKAGVTLEANTLRFWIETPELEDNQEWVEGDAVHFNEEGKTYTWTAIY